jgi:hypothetical protein
MLHWAPTALRVADAVAPSDCSAKARPLPEIRQRRGTSQCRRFRISKIAWPVAGTPLAALWR